MEVPVRTLRKFSTVTWRREEGREEGGREGRREGRDPEEQGMKRKERGGIESQDKGRRHN